MHPSNVCVSDTETFVFEIQADGRILFFKHSFLDLTCLISPTIFEIQKSLYLGSALRKYFLKHASLYV